MSPFIDLAPGERFGRLVVLERTADRGHEAQWLCLCDCGATKTIGGSTLRSGHTQSCGCYGRERRGERSLVDLTGRRFGELVVLRRAPDRPGRKDPKTSWLCRCDCGTEKAVDAGNLTSGNTETCGCRRRKAQAEYRAAHPVMGAENRRRRVSHQRLAVVDREAIWARDAGVCHLCGDAADPADWHLDHIIPIAHGGPHDPRNVAVSHPACNQQKNDLISFESPLIQGAIEAYLELNAA